MKKWILSIGLCCSITSILHAQVQIDRLQVDLQQSPIGITQATPTISWNILSAARNVQQQAFQVLVASSSNKLNEKEADLWNSGKVQTAQSQVVYGGKPLGSGQVFFVTLRAITNKGISVYSKPMRCVMGLMQLSDWHGKWIGYEKAFPWDSITQFSKLSARYYRKEFSQQKKVKQAFVHLVGLGMYELFINGKRVGDQVLAPAATDYRKNVLSNSFEVTKFLQPGKNALGVTLGNGRFFTMRQNYKTYKHNNFGYPKLLFQLNIEYTDGSSQEIVSDESWRFTADGPIRSNNDYDGEIYDARKELKGWNNIGYKDASWLEAAVVNAPSGQIQHQEQAPMKVMQLVKPISIKHLKGDVYIMDMGQNMTGWVQMQLMGKAGQTVKLRFAESLQKDGSLYMANLRDAKVTDIYTLKGGVQELWEPRFVYHGFRYVEISGFPGVPALSSFTGKMVYDNLETVGKFTSSNKTLNAIYRNAWWGIASNYKGMPLDCPQRNERQPWLGDRTVGSLGESYLFDHQLLYRKWMDDIMYAQNDAGMIPDVAPAFWNYYSDDITWPSTYIMVAEMLLRQYGDTVIVRKHYPTMKKWIDYIAQRHLKNGLIAKDKYGDWCMPPESLELIHAKDTSRQTNGSLLSTAYYYRTLTYMEQFARMMGTNADIENFAALRKVIQTSFNQTFYQSAKKQYSNNTITANLLPLYFDLVPDSARQAVFNQITTRILDKDLGHVSTGVIGNSWLMRGLSRNGRPDVAYTLATTETYPGWGYMVAQGATTIWELWNGNTANPEMNSQNHVMLLGDLLAWYYEDLAGIRPGATKNGFQELYMKPARIDGLNYVNASYRSTQGLIESSWKYTPQQFIWDIKVPANTKATLSIPADAIQYITEGGKPLNNVEGLTVVGNEMKRVILQIGSGTYHFISTFALKKGIVKDEFIYTEASFPEAHASTIVETPKGLLAAWFGGSYEGHKDVCIWTSHLDNGKWSAPVKVADGILNDSVRFACYNPVLYQIPGGELLLFYKIGPNVAGWSGWMKRSSDHGTTWSSAEKLPDGFLGPIKNKPIQIGDVLVCGSSTEKNGWKIHFEYTKDGGRTWTKSEDLNEGKIISAIQPSILKYPGNRYQILCRSKQRAIMESWSEDGGLTWSPMRATELPNNNSGTDAVTLQDGRQLLVYNHVKPAPDLPNGKGARTPLNVAISNDGIHWTPLLILEDNPEGQYSYPSVIQSKDGIVHIVYTWRREKVKYVCVDVARTESEGK